MELKFTVFTPTYNRAYTLTRLYESLKVQSYKSFEWLIVDDGSTDNTESLIKSFIDEKPFFNIKYIKTVNGGKHRAINKGLPHAKGELVFFLDSDDWLLNNSLQLIVEEEIKILPKDKSKVAAIEGLKCYTDGKIIGTTFNGDFIYSPYIGRTKYNISGDKAEVYYTDIVKKYPFPEYANEKFATERLVWNQISHDGYIIRWFNKPIQYCEYLDDGLTAGGYVMYSKYPKQWGKVIWQDYKFGSTSFYNTTIQIYIYYLYTKQHLNLNEISSNLSFSKFFVTYSIISQTFIDVLRFVFHKKTTIRKNVKNEIVLRDKKK